MSRVNVDAVALTDPRFTILATEAGLADADHALGKMVRVWHQCTLRETDVLSKQELAVLLGVEAERSSASLIASGLCEPIDDDDRLRVKGCSGRTDWLEAKRKAGKKGGRKSGESRRKKSEAKRSTASPNGKHTPSTREPIAPAPAPAPAPEEIPTGSSSGSPPDPSPDPLTLKARTVVACLARWSGRKLQPEAEGNHPQIKARLREGATVREMELVIEHRCAMWRKDGEFRKYLQPQTLFTKQHWPSYLLAAKEWDEAGRPNAERKALRPSRPEPVQARGHDLRGVGRG